METGLVLSLFASFSFAMAAVVVRKASAVAGEAFTSMAYSVFVGLPYFVLVLSFTGHWGELSGITWRVFLLLGAGTVLGGLPALLAGGLASTASTGETPVFLALAVGGSIFLLVLVSPLVFLGGLREVFLSSMWTLTYRELRPLTSFERKPLPGLGASGLEATPVA